MFLFASKSIDKCVSLEWQAGIDVFVTGHHMLVVEIISLVNGTIVSREGSSTQTYFPYSQFMQGKIMDEDYLQDMRFVMIETA